MSQKELLDRIKTMDISVVYNMSPEVLARLTDNFKEPFVRALLIRRKNNNEQRKLIKTIKEGYKNWKKETDFLWGTMPQLGTYPEYMEKLQFDIECDYIITAEGLAVEQKTRLEVDPVITLVQALNDTIKTNIDNELKPVKKESEESKKHMKELDSKYEQIDKRTGITKAEFDAIFNDDAGTQRYSEIIDNKSQTGVPVNTTATELEEKNKQEEKTQQRIKELEAQVEELQQKLAEGNNGQVWIDWLDNDVFKQNIKAEEIYKVLCRMSTPHLIDRPRCYVLFRVLSVIGGLKVNAAQKDILKWWNAHFKCGWHDDNQFKFTDLPDSIKNERDIFRWKICSGRNSEHYYSFAQDLLNALAWNKGRGEYEIKQFFLK